MAELCELVIFNMRKEQATIVVEKGNYSYQALNKIEKLSNFAAEVDLTFAN